MSNEYVFEMKDITKAFGRNVVLDGVSISIKPGEVRALMGENGAGKSTLMKILGGIFSADSGTVYMDGKEASIKTVDDARKYGVSFIHQEITNIPEMTIAENIFLGREPKNHLKLVDYRKMKHEAQKALDALGLDLDAGMLIRGLSVAQQQMIEIARAVNEGAKILILDEPTASLSKSETDNLFAQIDRLKKAGVAMIYISHRMEETFKVCDSVTVLRDGKFIGTRDTKETTENELISMMVGREFNNMYGNKRVIGGDVIMEVKHLTTDKVFDISFTLRKGEILGFSGLVGAGRTELALALFGIDSIQSGEIWLEGKKLTISKPKDAMNAGIALVPEERKEQGLFLGHSIATNLTFQVLSEFIHQLRVDKKKESNIVDEFKQKLSIKMASVEQTAGELSGGNQQKIVISKWLAAKPKVLILDEPTRGIDVGAKAEIYKLMHSLASEGVSIIMISSELPEIINNSSRVAIMREGHLAGILDQQETEATQEKIMSFAVGGEHTTC
ncbi:MULTISPECIES: sugar ABC transporter ATP-binding protein [Clostridia]|jgi:ABC-type sugar transport system ATPase subunit|uniref:D-ribose transporter ATP-binding protein n=1 Tax=Lacrimispora celerecrescens TaxID=29354 RepID=A0A084JM14_9FIRM|nr:MULTISPECIES: sugar ABC transporter ATP-binding protein [Clostridia]KEZ89998.1 D-ribose transporter ATP-binding protein [Lacrimispora celerecrescens]MBW4847047.1 sugar ABC transporter ATP-binding protein [Lachnospiraceae bacterium]MSS08744.1 sugar ABC transporter ATP-binding protein [Clostridium sp. WB02_MRS01]CUX60802.1 Ribose import ATP-binding protein RbsA [Clostridium sp. C105KSO15]